MACLDDHTVDRWLAGRLAGEARAHAEAHIDGCASCRELLGGAAAAHVGLRPGQRLGRYVVGEAIGAGAMGEVYAGHHPELDRQVAIKVVWPRVGADDAALIAEAQALARLAHPNVVTVFDVGVTPTDQLGGARGVWIAMELIDGTDAQAWARAQPVAERVAVLRDVARGLAAAHRAGLVHRDVKPANVVVGRDGRPRLVDFGLARDAAVASMPATAGVIDALGAATSGTSTAGTPAYMAPEVLRGGRATPASDQFSFGVLAHELLLGERPHRGATPAALAASIEARARGPLGGGLPPRVAAAIDRCLAAAPSARHASMDDVAGALAPMEPGQPRRAAGWVAAAGVAIAAASVMTWRLGASAPAASGPRCRAGTDLARQVWGDAERARASGAVPTVDAWTRAWAAEVDRACEAAPGRAASAVASIDRCLAQRRDELAALLARWDGPSGELARALSLLPAPDECAAPGRSGADALPLDPRRAAAIDALGRELATVRAAIALGDARPVLAAAAALQTRAEAADHAPTVAQAALVRADAERAAGDAMAADHAAIAAIAAAARGHDDGATADGWLARAAIAIDRRDYQRAAEHAELAAAAIARADAGERALARLATMRGLIAFGQGALGDAEARLRDAETRWRGLERPPGVELARVTSALGSVARAAGRLDDAARAHEDALAIDRSLLGPLHPAVARDLHNVAGVLRLRGELEQALARYRDALAIELATSGADHPTVGLTRNSIGLVFMAQRAWAVAEPELRAAVAILDRAGHGDRGLAHHNLGLVRAAQGAQAEALDELAEAERVYRASTGVATVAAARLPLDRARALAALGRHAEARVAAKAASTAALGVPGAAWIALDAADFLRGQPAAARPRPPRADDEVGAAALADATPTPAARTFIGLGSAPALPSLDVSPPPPPDPAAVRVGVYGSSH